MARTSCSLASSCNLWSTGETLVSGAAQSGPESERSGRRLRRGRLFIPKGFLTNRSRWSMSKLKGNRDGFHSNPSVSLKFSLKFGKNKKKKQTHIVGPPRFQAWNLSNAEMFLSEALLVECNIQCVAFDYSIEAGAFRAAAENSGRRPRRGSDWNRWKSDILRLQRLTDDYRCRTG